MYAFYVNYNSEGVTFYFGNASRRKKRDNIQIPNKKFLEHSAKDQVLWIQS